MKGGISHRSVELRLNLYVSSALLASFPADVAQEYGVFPLRRINQGYLLACARKPSAALSGELAERLGSKVHCISASTREFDQLLELVGEASKMGGPGNEAGRGLLRGSSAEWIGSLLVESGLQDLQEIDITLAVPVGVIQKIPEQLARISNILPVALVEDELIIAAGGFLESHVLRELRTVSGCRIDRLSARTDGLKEAVSKAYETQVATHDQPTMRLGEVLVSDGLLSEEQLDLCLAEQSQSRKRLGEILIKRGYISEEETYRALAVRAGCEFRQFEPSEIDLNLTYLVSRRFAEQNLVLPFALSTEGELTVVLADPFDLNVRDILDGIATQSGHKIRSVMASPFNIHQGIAFAYETEGVVKSAIEMQPVLHDPNAPHLDLIPSHEIPIIRKIINQILYSGVIEGASDIHIENLETRAQVRFRVDGVLESRKTPITKENVDSVISVLKVDARLDIAERRRSQDGVFKKRIGPDRVIDFRVNIHSTQFGEDAVIRILDRASTMLPLEALGFSPEMLGKFTRLIENPQGLILITGPTGSGKTTTIYSTLNHLNRGSKKILTAEDPIEYTLKGVSQSQVNEQIGNTFDEFARRFLRKDPDIILIGEIRDAKTAKACVNAALTGHLVFSTLHTNDTIGVVQRLKNLGVGTSAIGDSLLAVISQRLARKNCPKCTTSEEPSAELLNDFFGGNPPKGFSFRKGSGCQACRNKGYRGRFSLFEFWELDPHTQRIIAGQGSEDEIRDAALAGGLHLLLEDALAKTAAGVTSLSELARVVSIEQIRRYRAINQDRGN
ncbi:MAG: Flp pilus assembly complex ATPase component TadA [Acidobacteriota bacterium]|nr:MAG: Flp pilus assembly complex ATPase component TadA [Acidobacteriota bacterium]